MMNLEALVPICISMKAMHCLLCNSTELMGTVLDTLGFKAKPDLGWSVGRQKKIRRATAPGKLVADKDRFWRDLEKKYNDALKLLKWFQVSTQSPASAEDPEDFGPLCRVLMSMLLPVREEDIPAGYKNLVDFVCQSMESLTTRRTDALYGHQLPEDETRKTVKLIVDVFEKVYDLFNRVVPFIRDELLEVMDGPSNEAEMKYKLKERDETGDIDLAKRMDEVMLKRIRDISSLASTKANTNNTRRRHDLSDLLPITK